MVLCFRVFREVPDMGSRNVPPQPVLPSQPLLRSWPLPFLLRFPSHTGAGRFGKVGGKFIYKSSCLCPASIFAPTEVKWVICSEQVIQTIKLFLFMDL